VYLDDIVAQLAELPVPAVRVVRGVVRVLRFRPVELRDTALDDTQSGALALGTQPELNTGA
jgi:hypothetical protein